MSKKSEKELKKWRGRVNWAKSCSRNRRERWQQAMEVYLDDYTDTVNADDETVMIRVPLIYSVFATMLPMLFSSMPIVKASPKKPEDVEKSYLVESVIEDIFEKTNIYQEIKAVVLSAIIKGSGFLKVGFKADFQREEKSEDDILLTFQELFAGNTEASLEDFKKDDLNLYDEIITEEGVWVKYLENDKLHFDPEAKTLESSSFIVHQLYMPKEEFDKKYPNVKIDKKFLSTASFDESVTKEDRAKSSCYMESDDSKRVSVQEIWSKQTGEVITIADGHDDILEKSEWPYDVNIGYPFESLALAPQLDSIFGVELIMMLKDSARINKEMVNAEEDNAQRPSSGFLFGKGALEEDSIDELKQPGGSKTVEAIDINNIKEFSMPPNSPETYRVKSEMRRIVEETAHINAQVRQTSEEGKQTATEVKATAAAGGVLNYFKVREIERLIERTTVKMITFVKLFYDQPQLTKIDGRFGAPPDWIQWTGDEIGEYSFKVKAGSAAHQDTGLKLQQKMQYLQQVTQLVPFIPNPQILIQSLMEDIGDLQGINPEVIDQAFQQQQPVPGAVIEGPAGQEAGPPGIPSLSETAPGIASPGAESIEA